MTIQIKIVETPDCDGFSPQFGSVVAMNVVAFRALQVPLRCAGLVSVVGQYDGTKTTGSLAVQDGVGECDRVVHGDIHVEGHMLTIRGERKFEKDVNEDNYLRVERAYGSFMRSFSLPNTVSSETIRAEYRNGALTLHMAKREESKPKQIKISVSPNGK